MKTKKLVSLISSVALLSSLVTALPVKAEENINVIAFEDFSSDVYADKQVDLGDNGGTGWDGGFRSNLKADPDSPALNYKNDSGTALTYYPLNDDYGIQYVREDNKIYRYLETPIQYDVSGDYSFSYDMYVSSSSLNDYNMKFYLGSEIYGGVANKKEVVDGTTNYSAVGLARINETMSNSQVIKPQKNYTVVIALSIGENGEATVKEQIIPVGEDLKGSWDITETVTLTKDIEYIGMYASGWGCTSYYNNFKITDGIQESEPEPELTNDIAYEDFSADVYADKQVDLGDNGGTGWDGGFRSNLKADPDSPALNYKNDSGTALTYYPLNDDHGIQFVREDNKLYRYLENPIKYNVSRDYYFSYDMYVASSNLNAYNTKFYLGSEVYGGVANIKEVVDGTTNYPAVGLARINETKSEAQVVEPGKSYTVIIKLSIGENGEATVKEQIIPVGGVLKEEWDVTEAVTLTKNIEYIGMYASGWGNTSYYKNFAIDTYTNEEWELFIGQATYTNIADKIAAINLKGRIAEIAKSGIEGSVIYEDFESYANVTVSESVLNENKTGTLDGGYGFDGPWYLDSKPSNSVSNVSIKGEYNTYASDIHMRRDLKSPITSAADGEYFITATISNNADNTAATSPERQNINNRFILQSEATQKTSASTYVGIVYDAEKGGYVPVISINSTVTKGSKVLQLKYGVDFSARSEYRYFTNISIKDGNATVSLMVIDKNMPLQKEWDVTATGKITDISYIGFNQAFNTWYVSHLDDIIIEKYDSDVIAAVEEDLASTEILGNGLASEYYTTAASFNDGKITVQSAMLENGDNRKLYSWNAAESYMKDKGILSALHLKNGTGEEKEVTLVLGVYVYDMVDKIVDGDVVLDEDGYPEKVPGENHNKFVTLITKKVTLPKDKYSGRIDIGFTQEELAEFSVDGGVDGFIYKPFVWDGLGNLTPLTEAVEKEEFGIPAIVIEE